MELQRPAEPAGGGLLDQQVQGRRGRRHLAASLGKIAVGVAVAVGTKEGQKIIELIGQAANSLGS